MYSQVTPKCWKCQCTRADYYHMWWGCPNISDFWKIGLILSSILGVAVPIEPRLMLLLDFEHFQLDCYRRLLANLFTAVSLLIASVWKLEMAPSMKVWITKISYMCLMGKLSALAKYRQGVESTITDYTNCWPPILQAGCIDQSIWKFG